jgi:hypothetical protein
MWPAVRLPALLASFISQKDVLVVSCLFATAASTSTTTAQTATYSFPAPDWPSPTTNKQVDTTINETTKTSGCENSSLDSDVTQYSSGVELLYPPLWYERQSTPWQPGYGGVEFSFSLVPTADPLEVVNGLSQGQGTVSETLTSGTYPASFGTGNGASGTYTITVGGETVTENYTLNIQLMDVVGPWTVNKSQTYIIQSVYNFASGVQTYSFTFNSRWTQDNNTELPGCVETGTVAQTGTASVQPTAR